MVSGWEIFYFNEVIFHNLLSPEQPMSFLCPVPSLSRGMLHSNPMDYAWGVDGLDAIITQVLWPSEATSLWMRQQNVLLIITSS